MAPVVDVETDLITKNRQTVPRNGAWRRLLNQPMFGDAIHNQHMRG